MRKAADAKLAKASSDAGYVAEMQKKQVASELSLQDLSAEFTTVQAQLIQVTGVKRQLSTALAFVAEGSDERFKTLAAICGARYVADGLVRSNVAQSVDFLVAFINQARAELMNCFRIGFVGAYAGSQLAFPYMSTYVSGVGATSVKVYSPAPPDWRGRYAAATNTSMPVSLKPSTPPVKNSEAIPRIFIGNVLFTTCGLSLAVDK